MTDLTRLARGSILRVTTTVTTLAITFLLAPFVVRRLGDHWYGVWVVTSGIGFYFNLMDFGLSSAVSRFVTTEIARQDHRRVNEVVTTAFAVYLGLALLVVLATVGISAAVPWMVEAGSVRIVRVVVLLQGLGLALSFPSRSFVGIAVAQLRYDLLEILAIGQALANALLTVVVLMNNGGIIGVSCASFVVGRAYQVTSFFLAKHLWPTLEVRACHVRTSAAREMLGYSAWSFVQQVSDMLRFRIDTAVVGGICGASVVTHYSIGASLAEYSLNLLNRTTNVFTPLFVRFHAKEDQGAIRWTLLSLTRINAALSFFGFGLVFVLGRLFISRWMGEAYLDAYSVFAALGAALMVEAVMLPSANTLYALARHRPYAIATLCEACANTALSILLVRRYGMVGVAIGTAIPLVVSQLVFTPLYTCRVVGLDPRRLYGHILWSAAVTGGFLMLVRFVVVHWSVPPTYTAIMTVPCVALAVFAPLAYYCILGARERDLARRMLASVVTLGKNGARTV